MHIGSWRTERMQHFRLVGVIALAVAVLPAARVSGQDGPSEITGKAILEHSAGRAVLAAAPLVKAGRLADVRLASVREVRDEWMALPDAEKEDESSRAQERGPDPTTLEAEIARRGVLTIYGESASLLVPSADERSAVMAFCSLEDGTWRVTAGPMTIDTAPVGEVEPGLVGGEILDHEIGRVVLAYARSIEAEGVDSAMELATTAARAKRVALSDEDRSASDRYLLSILPGASELADQIREGGQVFVDGDRAYLNVAVSTRTERPDGTVDFSSSSFALPLEVEDGGWKIAD